MIDSKTTVEWNGDALLAAMRTATDAGLTAAAQQGADECVRNIGSEGGDVIGYMVGGHFQAGKMNGKKARGRKVFKSSPKGGFPGTRTGNLRNSVAYVSPEGMGTPGRAAFGTAVDYGRWLEFGTSRMAARPWLLRSARMAQARMAAAFRKVSAATFDALTARGRP